MFDSLVTEAEVADAPPELWSPEVLPDADPSGWAALEIDCATVDPAQLTDAELVDAAVVLERVAAWAQARQARVLAEFARRRPADPAEAVQSDTASVLSPYAADEVGLALHLARGAAAARLAQSTQLAERLPGTLALWERGRLDSSRVRVVCEATAALSAQDTGAVEARVIERAPGQTRGQLLASVNRAVLALDGEAANRRHRAARQERRVAVGDERDGMASLWALLPAPDAVASYEWLSRLARSLGRDDPRGMDARRADLLADLLTGRCAFTRAAGDTSGTTNGNNSTTNSGNGTDTGPGAGRGDGLAPPATGSTEPAGPVRRPAPPGKPLVHVVMPYTTLIGVDDQPGELAGFGPIPADLAREIAADAVWTRLVTDPLSGALLDHGRTTYRPPEALADFVRARDQQCRSPICRRRAASCELDHAVAWQDGGDTAEHNLWTGCAHDHHAKHAPGWSVELDAGGELTWTTPTGHRYRSEPHDHRPEP